ncbi:hypothetical protein B0O80DRAFT_455895 [Mortierella sp. GBAus27b]|nr:hypothetical protein BGX31_011055 [Mortierella sp. GBA43]KAI8351711.1 hypothetical protein B0O80DRAFT_455895 [Mortierella sp. GBAus27b]
MSTFSPPPTDNMDRCGRSCPKGQSCFIYSGGFLCQPYTQSGDYPLTGMNSTEINPPQWYLADAYPAVRYTGSLVNQVQNANCTTIPVPQDQLYVRLLQYIMYADLGGAYSVLDDLYSSTLVQYRGNCAEGFYCQPSVPVYTSVIHQDQRINVPGSLPGTCQPLLNDTSTCVSTNMCQGWHIQPSGQFGDNQFRCSPVDSSLTTPVGRCKQYFEPRPQSFLEKATNMFLFSALVVILVLFVYMWYRRHKHRQRMMAMSANANDPRRGGVYRPPDGTDNGELPAYGAHRRDERVIEAGPDTIVMYTYPSQPSQQQPFPGRPVHQSYPFPMNHPGLQTPNSQETPSSGPITSHQAGLAAAIVSQEAGRLRGSAPLPPAYNTSSPERPPSPTTAAAIAAAVTGTTNMIPTPATDTNAATRGVVGAESPAGEKQQQGLSPSIDHDPSQVSDKKEKEREQETELGRTQSLDADQASTSSSASGSRSGASSSVHGGENPKS